MTELPSERHRLAVLGSPISHSKSPAIHRAAYAVLGLDWEYDAVEVNESTLEEFARSRDAQWRGLSLTMPLKRGILPLLTRRDPIVDLVGAANTVLFTDDGLAGFNTDVPGVERSFREADVTALDVVHVLGGGATAASVIAGVARLGASRVIVSARTPDHALPLVDLGTALGIDVTIRPWGVMDSSAIVPDAVVSTVPGGQNDMRFSERVRAESVLFDVAYDPWPSAAAQEWAQAGGRVISGLDLLINQAVLQIRLFVNGEAETPLVLEHFVVAAMRSAV